LLWIMMKPFFVSAFLLSLLKWWGGTCTSCTFFFWFTSTDFIFYN
jgi:hypothetical protein